MYKQIYIGIDQSYANTGISIVVDGKLKDIKSVRLDKYKNNSRRRGALAKRLVALLAHVIDKAENVTVICEAARLHGGRTSFINIDAIKAMGALTSVIVDCADKFGVEVYSVDTRCWKAQVVGTSKPESNKYGVPDEKWPTVRWVLNQGFESKVLIELPENSRKRKGTFIGKDGHTRYMYNNDACDSAGIAMFGVVGDRDKLSKEK